MGLEDPPVVCDDWELCEAPVPWIVVPFVCYGLELVSPMRGDAGKDLLELVVALEAMEEVEEECVVPLVDRYKVDQDHRCQQDYHC